MRTSPKIFNIFRNAKFEYKITISYLIFGFLWILFSDKILDLVVKDRSLLTEFQTFKGAFFILVTTLLLYLLVMNHMKRLRMAEEVVVKLNETLEQRVILRTEQLESANKELEAFNYSVSHDLRAPLRLINGYIELLEEQYGENLPDAALPYLSIITDSTHQMDKLIDDLLELSSLGRQELNLLKLDMATLVNEVIERLMKGYQGRKILWNVQDLPEVYGDFSLLKQVWFNLADNAAKYTRGKDSAEINIGFRDENEYLVFYIQDNGVGFDMKHAHKLFGAFQRLHSRSEFEGTGVGLAIVKRIVEKHHGTTWFESAPGQGATFFFSLPKK